MFGSCVLQQYKVYGYRIKKGNKVIIELDSREKKLYFFLNGIFLPFVLTEVEFKLFLICGILPMKLNILP
jgi:hypothetical protein